MNNVTIFSKSTIAIIVNLIFLLFSIFPLCAQQSFLYQAVVRDSAGVPLDSQMVGVRVSLIESQITAPPSYVETHIVQSNEYGVISLHVGEGTVVSGVFSDIDWSLPGFMQVEMDLAGGTNYDLSSTTEILSVPRSLYALEAGSLPGRRFGLVVTDFGATGDGATDDTDAFETAIDSAAQTGGSVLIPAGIYQISQTLTLPDGVRMRGEGMGSELLQTPYNGSLLRFTGSGEAINIKGSAAGLEDLALLDQSNGGASAGIRVLANNDLVENVFLSNVLISNFTNGTGLMLRARNNGGIAYGTFYNVRVRNAKHGYQIYQDAGSFINSNSFYNGVISGGGFKYGIRIRGGNNNVFNGTVIEPPESQSGHLVVENGEIQGKQIRVEGTQQDPDVPLILFADSTSNSTLTGTYAGGLTLDKGNNFINMKSGKAIHFRNASTNLFRNAAFISSDSLLPTDWMVSGAGVTTRVLAPELTPLHQVVKITVPAGVTATFEPEAKSVPGIGTLPLYGQVNFGFYVKTTTGGIVFAGTNAPAGYTTSQAHSGSGEWEFVGMNAAVNLAQPQQFELLVQNTTGSATEVYVTTPTLSYGNQLPVLDPAPLTPAGGQLYGMLSYSLVSASTPANGFLVLPQTANYFNITNNTTILRINHSGPDRFPRGSVITLLFDVPGTNVTSSAYLNLKGGFTSVANGSLSLLSLGDGTWREVGRN